MRDGYSGSTWQDENNCVEPPRDTGNRTFTDYGQSPAVKQNRSQAFREGTGRGSN